MPWDIVWPCVALEHCVAARMCATPQPSIQQGSSYQLAVVGDCLLSLPLPPLRGHPWHVWLLWMHTKTGAFSTPDTCR